MTFNGIAAPLLYVSPTQISAVVPFSLAGQTSLQVAVQRFQQVSATVTAPLQATAPAIFTSNQSGSRQGAILEQASDGSITYNRSSNPASAGETLTILATGQGVWTPPPQADIFVFGEPFTTAPVSLTIGVQPAKITNLHTYGTFFNWGMLAVTAVMPSGVSPGAQPVLLTIGTNSNSQQTATIAVQ